MEIIIKQVTPFTIEIKDTEGKTKTENRLSIYFDVVTVDRNYVDNENIGYFPIKMIGDANTSIEDISAACTLWITSNDVLSKYQGKIRTRHGDIESEIRKKYTIDDEIGLLADVMSGVKIKDDPEIITWRAVVQAAKDKYPKNSLIIHNEN